jgi:3-phosphoshikimate 1-carboxyvinyltransferase
MFYKIFPPEKINVALQLPASKSLSARALIINALSGRKASIENLSDSDDTNALVKAFSSDNQTVDIGAAGTAMRFLTAFFAQTDNTRILTGSERMKNRPVKILVDALNFLGADIQYIEKQGFPPLKINGKKLRGGNVSLDGGISSQYLSALMMIAPMMDNGLIINLEGNIISRPYIEMTVRLMEYFGVKTKIDGNTFFISPQNYLPRPYIVESDWSAASYFYEIAALAKDETKITLKGLNKNSLQGDSRVAELFSRLGVETHFEISGVSLFKKKSVTLPTFFECDFTDIPDLAQTFVVTCCMLGIKFRFGGLQSLRIKETDRIAALQAELKKLGFLLDAQPDNSLEWNGKVCEPEKNPVIATYDDHRMAMAFAPACLKIGKIGICEPQVVSKSYPAFWQDLETAGFIRELQDDLSTNGH